MTIRPALTTAFLLAALFVDAPHVGAQAVSLQIANGLVTLDARNVSVSEILERWAAVGRVTIVNGDTLANSRVTLQLVDVPERTALATLLRNVSGYILAGRGDGAGYTGHIDRILIVPESSSIASTQAHDVRPAPRNDVPTNFIGAAPLVGSVRQRQDGAALSTNGTARFGAPADGAGAMLMPPRPVQGVYSGEGSPNLPSGVDPATADDDLSRYDGLREPRPVEEGTDQKAASPNPFGVTQGAARPGMPPPPRSPSNGGGTPETGAGR